MTYGINIDQEFAVHNDLTLTQVATLAAFLTLPYWVKAIIHEGEIWYTYSDEKMAQDFPLLFGVPKRCYKNLSELEARGFVVVGKVGRTKIVRFTELCATWNKEKSEIGLNFCGKSEIGLKKSEIGLIFEKEEKCTKEERDITTSINTQNKKENIEKKKEKTTEEKVAAFKVSCEKYVERYGREMVSEFFNHYAQICDNGELLCERKRRIDGAFDIGRRMATWASNDKKWNAGRRGYVSPQPQPTTQPKPTRTPWEEMGLTQEEYNKIIVNG